MKIPYDNEMLLEIVKAHIDDYDDNIDEVDFIVIDGQTIDGTRIVSITVGSKDNTDGEHSLIKTGDEMEIDI